MASATKIPDGLDPAVAVNLARGLKAMKDTLGEKSARQAILYMFEIGSANVRDLLNDDDPGEKITPKAQQPASTSGSERSPSPKTKQIVANSRTGSRSAKVNPNSALAVPCPFPGCSKMYKRVRGIKEHLVLTHGLPIERAELLAKAGPRKNERNNRDEPTFLQSEGSQDSSVFHGGDMTALSGQMDNTSEITDLIRLGTTDTEEQTASYNLMTFFGDYNLPRYLQSAYAPMDAEGAASHDTHAAQLWNPIYPDQPPESGRGQ